MGLFDDKLSVQSLMAGLIFTFMLMLSIGLFGSYALFHFIAYILI